MKFIRNLHKLIKKEGWQPVIYERAFDLKKKYQNYLLEEEKYLN